MALCLCLWCRVVEVEVFLFDGFLWGVLCFIADWCKLTLR